jgi:hypothetical protein
MAFLESILPQIFILPNLDINKNQNYHGLSICFQYVQDGQEQPETYPKNWSGLYSIRF